MSATEELRRLLDARGVRYEKDDTQVSDTEWYYVTKLCDGYRDEWTYEEPPDTDLLVSYQYDLGAEDAIAATLGPGTCKRVYGGKKYGNDKIVCSKCGYGIRDRRFNYCPSCGCRIENTVEEYYAEMYE